MNDNLYTYKAFCTNVVDGDTIDCNIDLGFGVGYKIRVRMYGINTPEIHGSKSKDPEEKSKGMQVKKYLEELVLNKNIILKTYKDSKEKYGRYLAEVYINNETTVSVNQLVKEYCRKNFGIDISFMENLT